MGGAGSLIIPNGSVGRPDVISSTLLQAAEIDQLSVIEQSPADDLKADGYRTGRWTGVPLLSFLVSKGRSVDDWRPTLVSMLAPDHPWSIAYAATLGLWPATPNADILRWAQLRPDVSFEEIIRTEYEDVYSAGVEDLDRRLQATDTVNPSRLSLIDLQLRPKTVTHRGEQVLPDSSWIADSYAGNIVVAYEPGSVHDLCLLWNLRALHDAPLGLPLGLPYSECFAQDAQKIVAIGSNAQLFRPRYALTSASISIEKLRELAGDLGSDWSAIQPDELLRPGKPLGRRSADVAVFDGGRARVPPFSPADRDLLDRVPALGGVTTETRLHPLARPLPPIRALRGDAGWGAYRHGSFVEVPSRHKGLTELRWPPGWTVLEGAARDRDLVCQPNRPGAAAAALLTAIGGEATLQAIASPEVVAPLHRLGERRGISWFRERFRTLASEVNSTEEPGRLERLESAIDQLWARPLDEQQVAISADDVARKLGRAASGPWLEWAEAATVVVRGAELKCDGCGARSWRAIGELAPPIVCRGCGDVIRQAFPPDALRFSYRGSEALLNAVEFDSLSHLVVVRWFSHLWHEAFDKPSDLYGFYPGVEFREKTSPQVVGEADVILLTARGELVPEEVKRRGAGLTESELAKLERLRVRLGASWSFVATLDWAAECPPIWKEAQVTLPATPRFALTAEHLFNPFVAWLLGQNPFEWHESTAVEQHEVGTKFLEALPATLEWLRSDDPVPYWDGPFG